MCKIMKCHNCEHEISRKIKIGFSVENSNRGGIKFCAILPCCQNKISKTFLGFTENQTQNTRKIKFENPLRFNGRGGIKNRAFF